MDKKEAEETLKKYENFTQTIKDFYTLKITSFITNSKKVKNLLKNDETLKILLDNKNTIKFVNERIDEFFYEFYTKMNQNKIDDLEREIIKLEFEKNDFENIKKKNERLNELLFIIENEKENLLMKFFDFLKILKFRKKIKLEKNEKNIFEEIRIFKEFFFFELKKIKNIFLKIRKNFYEKIGSKKILINEKNEEIENLRICNKDLNLKIDNFENEINFLKNVKSKNLFFEEEIKKIKLELEKKKKIIFENSKKFENEKNKFFEKEKKNKKKFRKNFRRKK